MAVPEIGSGWSCTTEGGRTALCAESGGQIVLAGLFEAFFEAYWVRYTALRQVSFCCRLTGSMRLRISRRSGTNGRDVPVAELAADGEGRALDLRVDLAAEGEDYLIISITADPGTRIEDLAWRADAPPLRDVRLGVAITSYNREEFLLPNLRALLAGRSPVDEIVVVNHGTPDLARRLPDDIRASPALHSVEQPNSGGAGGFTRGMLEHWRRGKATHILLMDDDIELPPDLLERITAVLAYATQPICLGGAMFDYHHRTRLFTAGDSLKPGSFGIVHCAPDGGCDVAGAQGLAYLARHHDSDFNGWWCFAFPVDALESVGLPMPCFIRGDDVEYGYRLKRAGLPTVGWPGIAVWHLPFADKSSAWHMFYDRRNSLFANAIHRRLGRWQAFNAFSGGFVHHLLRYDYDRVEAMTRGVEAFNRGPAAMAAWTHEEHARLVERVSRPRAPEMVTTAAVAEMPSPRRLQGSSRSPLMAARLIKDLLLPFRPAVAGSLPHGMAWRPDYDLRPAAVIERTDDGDRATLYRYSWRRTVTALARHALAMAGMAMRFHPAMPSYALPAERSPRRET